jgi:hypothetical protein
LLILDEGIVVYFLDLLVAELQLVLKVIKTQLDVYDDLPDLPLDRLVFFVFCGLDHLGLDELRSVLRKQHFWRQFCQAYWLCDLAVSFQIVQGVDPEISDTGSEKERLLNQIRSIVGDVLWSDV